MEENYSQRERLRRKKKIWSVEKMVNNSAEIKNKQTVLFLLNDDRCKWCIKLCFQGTSAVL